MITLLHNHLKIVVTNSMCIQYPLKFEQQYTVSSMNVVLPVLQALLIIHLLNQLCYCVQCTFICGFFCENCIFPNYLFKLNIKKFRKLIKMRAMCWPIRSFFK